MVGIVHPFLRTLITPPKPRIIGITTNTSTGTPITITYPAAARGSGLLVLCLIIRHNSGAAANPGVPTGFTSLGAATTNPTFRIAYRYFDGSEGLTNTSASTGATSMSAFCIAIAGVTNFTGTRELVSGTANVTGTSTAPNAGAFSIGSNALVIRRPTLYINWSAWNGNGSITEFPIGYPLYQTQFTQGTNGGQAISAKYGSLPGEDASASTLSASLTWRANTLAVAAG